MLAHCALHPLCYLALTFPYIRDYWIDNPLFRVPGWLCIVIVFVAHYIEDQWRVFTIFKYKTPDNTLYFIWDQVIHYAVIFSVIPMGLHSVPFRLIPEIWPVIGCLVVITTHACTVLVYFIEKDLYKKDFPGDWEKYLGMLWRLVLMLCFLLPGIWSVLAGGAWFSTLYSARRKKYLDLSWLGYYFGSAVAASCGLAARWLCYY